MRLTLKIGRNSVCPVLSCCHFRDTDARQRPTELQQLSRCIRWICGNPTAQTKQTCLAGDRNQRRTAAALQESASSRICDIDLPVSPETGEYLSPPLGLDRAETGGEEFSGPFPAEISSEFPVSNAERRDAKTSKDRKGSVPDVPRSSMRSGCSCRWVGLGRHRQRGIGISWKLPIFDRGQVTAPRLQQLEVTSRDSDEKEAGLLCCDSDTRTASPLPCNQHWTISTSHGSRNGGAK